MLLAFRIFLRLLLVAVAGIRVSCFGPGFPLRSASKRGILIFRVSIQGDCGLCLPLSLLLKCTLTIFILRACVYMCCCFFSIDRGGAHRAWLDAWCYFSLFKDGAELAEFVKANADVVSASPDGSKVSQSSKGCLDVADNKLNDANPWIQPGRSSLLHLGPFSLVKAGPWRNCKEPRCRPSASSRDPGRYALCGGELALQDVLGVPSVALTSLLWQLLWH